MVFRNVRETPSLDSAGAPWLRYLALGHSQLSAKGRVFLEAKSHQLGSLFVLEYLVELA